MRRLEAEGLHRRSLAEIERGTIESRRAAIQHLERAVMLAPDQPEYELTLGRAYYRAGFLREARRHFERVAALAPDDAEARFGLGQVWRRDWLKYLDASSLVRATDHFLASARSDPAHVDAWLQLSALQIERADLAAARFAALEAVRASGGSPEALLACAATHWRLGGLESADSAFRQAIPRLRRSIRERFEDIAPIATEADTAALRRLPAAEREDFLRRFWRDQDPDLATDMNEARLEYWTRVAQAYFLFYDPRRGEWDERGEMYVRYGPPTKVVYNPVGGNLTVRMGAHGLFPANVLVWSYPQLGMNVTLQDRLLSEYYLKPISMTHDPDPRPDPDSVAATEALASGNGRGVFPSRPPGSKPMPFHGTIARFEGPDAAKLLAGVEVQGAPTDSVWAEIVVVDSLRREVVRAARPLANSACAPTAQRVADFSLDVPAGQHVVGISVRGAGGRRSTRRWDVRVPPAAQALSMSDLVVTCGTSDPGGGRVRPEPNPSARVGAADELSVYYEIYHLDTDSTGFAHFEYEYAVRSAEADRRIWIQRAFSPRRTSDPIQGSRDARQAGAIRRQFLSIPVQALLPGRYRVEVRVREPATGLDVSRVAEFVRDADRSAAPDRGR